MHRILVTSSLPRFFEASKTSMPMMRPFLSRSMNTFSASSSLRSRLRLQGERLVFLHGFCLAGVFLQGTLRALTCVLQQVL